ncbi:phosphohistidine swiveling domain-containing protein [Actinopolymorpha pittospori]|uniref:Phosphohistidine swiveling domain-containing protein n=1 Tax=Actinopolymorpha pittospori TaxID=648752 RepID=A0A927MZ27_9ACTN|nr:phosphohistidine swiveling domain-containing protein [Actinopolymorpha pittospori]
MAEAPARFDRVTARVGDATTPSELADLWRDALEPYLRDASRLLAAGARSDNNAQVRIQARVRALASEADTNALLTGLQGGDAQLASLGPLVGLAQLRRREIDRETYARSWGHRGPHEFEVSIPRPAEDPYWTDRQLAEMEQAKADANDLLARQESARTAAWERLGRTHPRAVRSLRRRIDRAAHAARAREAGRSEVIRAFWAMRVFILRAGELTGHGDDLFLCTIQEIQRILAGDETPLARIPIRRRTYEHYRSLPVTPTLIRGTIDPERWAADPNRRGDVHDATAEHLPMSDTVTGFPGASGVVEGLVRVVSTPDQGDELRAGEILVTAVTNIGWTPLFPRAAAVVTDVGAPLSHAAIVARELGIPAVVGCGNATLRLHTGDRVRVDGEHGTVDVLEPAAR